MRTDYETLLLERPEPAVLLVTLNRPARSNAFNTQMASELRDLFGSLHADQHEVRCVVLTGAGDRSFCAGADLKDRRELSTETWQEQHAIYEQMAVAILDCPVVILAAVNGAAFGGGCELALAADFAYAGESARFALPETRLGIIPGTGGTQNLPRACGVRRAKEIILTGDPFSAQQALQWEIVNRVCKDDSLMDESLETARRIAANAPIAVRQAKRAINKATQVDLRTGYAFEVEVYQQTVPTEDRLEGMRAFEEKREPRFKGR